MKRKSCAKADRAWQPFPAVLPKEQGVYLLTVYDPTYNTNFITMGLYSLSHRRFAPDRGRSKNVLAWRNVPKPYSRKPQEAAE